MPLVSARAARRICETRMSSLHYNGGTCARTRSATLTENEFACLARDALLCLGALALRLVLGVERPGDSNHTLGVMPDLPVGEIAENAGKQEEHRHADAGGMA